MPKLSPTERLIRVVLADGKKLTFTQLIDATGISPTFFARKAKDYEAAGTLTRTYDDAGTTLYSLPPAA